MKLWRMKDGSLLLLLIILQSCFSLSVQRYASLIALGDSLTDTGNFLLTGENMRFGIGRLPYGMTFFHHATGRYSDGRIIIDFVAEALELPLLPPSFANRTDFHQGVSFAVGGATALAPKFFQDKGLIVFANFSLSDQLGSFEKLIKPSIFGNSDEEYSKYFKSSLIFVGEFGVNDYLIPLVAAKSAKEMRSYTPKVIRTISAATERLIGLGAKNLVVPGVLPIGCMGVTVKIFYGSSNKTFEQSTGCVRKMNKLSEYHNHLLQGELRRLQTKYPDTRITYADYYTPLHHIALHPGLSGFSNGALRACCSGGGPFNVNATAVCGQTGSTACQDPSTYVDWDSIHLTEAANRVVAASVLKNIP